MQVLYTVLMTCPWIPSEARCLKLTRNQPVPRLLWMDLQYDVDPRVVILQMAESEILLFFFFFRQLSKQYFQTVLNWAPVWKLLENVPQNTCWRIVFISLMGLGLIPLFQFQFPFNQFRFQFPVWREWILIGINPNPDP